MQREQLKLIMDMMAKHGIIRITYDPCALDHTVEIWSRHGKGMDDRDLEFWRPSKEEVEYYAHEYDKCFGTAPRSDEE